MLDHEVNQDSLEQEIDNLKNRMEADKPPVWILGVAIALLVSGLLLFLLEIGFRVMNPTIWQDSIGVMSEVASLLLAIGVVGIHTAIKTFHVLERPGKFYDLTRILYAQSDGMFRQFVWTELEESKESDEAFADRFAYVVGEVYQVGISEDGIPAKIHYEKQNLFQLKKQDVGIQEFDLEITFKNQSIEPGPNEFSGCAFEFEKGTGLNQNVYVYLGDWYPVEKMEKTMEEITFDSVMGSQEDMSQQFRAFAEDATEAMSVLDYEWFWTMSEFCKEHPVRMAICYRPESICVAVSGKKDLFQIAYGTPEEEIRTKVDDVYGLLCKLTEAVMLTDEMESDA